MLTIILKMISVLLVEFKKRGFTYKLCFSRNKKFDTEWFGKNPEPQQLKIFSSQSYFSTTYGRLFESSKNRLH